MDNWEIKQGAGPAGIVEVWRNGIALASYMPQFGGAGGRWVQKGVRDALWMCNRGIPIQALDWLEGARVTWTERLFHHPLEYRV